MTREGRVKCIHAETLQDMQMQERRERRREGRKGLGSDRLEAEEACRGGPMASSTARPLTRGHITARTHTRPGERANWPKP